MGHRDLLETASAPEDTVIQVEGSHASWGFFELRTQRLAAFEREYLSGLLDRHRGDVSCAAREAQLPRGTVYRLLKKHGLAPKAFRKRQPAVTAV